MFQEAEYVHVQQDTVGMVKDSMVASSQVVVVVVVVVVVAAAVAQAP